MSVIGQSNLRADVRRFDIRQNFQRLLRLNSPRTFGELRSLYRLAASGVQYGIRSGYAP